MPVSDFNRKAKTYQVVTQAGGTNVAPVPANPNRVALTIQNTGPNAGNFRFGDPCQFNGSDLVFSPGDRETWDQSDTVPLEGLNFAASTATTWSVVEVVRVRNN